jgi:hypothetical protein
VERKHRQPKYDKEVVFALKNIWELYHKPCSEILHSTLQGDKSKEIYANQNIISHRLLIARQRSFCLDD